MNPNSQGTGPSAAGSESNLVVARFRDGRVIKGHTRDFLPGSPFFHILPHGALQTVEIDTAELKAVFFVRDLTGNKWFHKKRAFPAFDAGPGGRRIAVVFEDGELLIGHTQTYVGDAPGFFVFPLDARENNTRAYVLRAATTDVRLGPGAEELARNTPRPPNEDAARRRRIFGDG